MENRRENYRHEFAPGEALIAELSSKQEGQVFIGEVLSLSAGGVGVHIPRKENLFKTNERIFLRFTIPHREIPLEIPVLVKRIRSIEKGMYYGLEFLPSADPSLDPNRDRVIWGFLMELQRQSLRVQNHQKKPDAEKD